VPHSAWLAWAGRFRSGPQPRVGACLVFGRPIGPDASRTPSQFLPTLNAPRARAVVIMRRMILGVQHPITRRSVALPAYLVLLFTGSGQCNGTALSDAALAAAASAPVTPGLRDVQACPVPAWQPPRTRGRPVRSQCSPPCSHRKHPPPPTKIILYVVAGGGCPSVRASTSPPSSVRPALRGTGGPPAPRSCRTRRLWRSCREPATIRALMAGSRDSGVDLA
jgi:hypothetical protein